jgi:hypothetical protein
MLHPQVSRELVGKYYLGSTTAAFLYIISLGSYAEYIPLVEYHHPAALASS